MSGFQVPLPPGGRIRGVVVSSELRTVDYMARNLEFAASVPPALVEAVVHNIMQVVA